MIDVKTTSTVTSSFLGQYTRDRPEDQREGKLTSLSISTNLLRSVAIRRRILKN